MSLSKFESLVRNLARLAESANINSETIAITNKTQSHVAILGRDPSDDSSTLMLRTAPSDEAQLVAKVMPNGQCGLRIVDESSEALAQINNLPAVIVSAEGRGGIVMVADPKTNHPEILMVDREDRQRVSLSLGPDGAPSLTFFDSEGRVSWSAPPAV